MGIRGVSFSDRRYGCHIPHSYLFMIHTLYYNEQTFFQGFLVILKRMPENFENMIPWCYICILACSNFQPHSSCEKLNHYSSKTRKRASPFCYSMRKKYFSTIYFMEMNLHKYISVEVGLARYIDLYNYRNIFLQEGLFV